MRDHRPACLTTVLLLGLLTAGVAVAHAQGYTYTTIDVPGSTETRVMAVNATSGQAVGWFVAYPGVHGFSWDGTTVTTFDVAFDVQGGGVTQAYGVNSAGQIVGDTIDLRRGFLRDTDGTVTLFDVPGALTTSARGINSSGRIVGVYTTSDQSGRLRGFLCDYWCTTNFQLFDIPFAAVASLQNLMITDSGSVIALFTSGAGDSAVSWVVTALLPRPSVPGAIGTEVRGINEVGQIVGNWSDGRVFHGFVGTSP